MTDYRRRVMQEEMMDDFTIVDDRLRGALDELRWVNRLLGGYAATGSHLKPFLRASAGGSVRILDLGTGVADLPERIVRWTERYGVDAEVVGLDANAATVAHARDVLDARLPAALRRRVKVVQGDALRTGFADKSFDVVTAVLFLHHLEDDAAVGLLREMDRLARAGILVNDLHRHPLAYHGIRLIGAAFPVSPMFRHDGPVSVLRAFRRAELAALARGAGLPEARLRWHWAFRWTLSTLDR